MALSRKSLRCGAVVGNANCKNRLINIVRNKPLSCTDWQAASIICGSIFACASSSGVVATLAATKVCFRIAAYTWPLKEVILPAIFPC
ncbi:hypothetical protein D3C80_1446530 [compost metagenome]